MKANISQSCESQIAPPRIARAIDGLRILPIADSDDDEHRIREALRREFVAGAFND